MNKKTWIALFLLTLALHIASDYLPLSYLSYITKPLLMILLLTGFISASKGLHSALKKWVIIALIFSWVGDVLLMFQEKEPLFFLLGLSAFLLAHIFYILFFHGIKKEESISSRWWLLVPVVVYYTVLIGVLYPHLADMKVPVPVYGIVISFMLLLALHTLFIKNKTAGQWMAAGAMFFIISDSVLAINKFYQSFEAANIIIMLTYGLAQLFIVLGAIHYFRNKV
ncbi:MAG TPA: lysoplasmalogenase [Chitinophagaceae bacterium]